MVGSRSALGTFLVVSILAAVLGLYFPALTSAMHSLRLGSDLFNLTSCLAIVRYFAIVDAGEAAFAGLASARVTYSSFTLDFCDAAIVGSGIEISPYLCASAMSCAN